MIEDLLPLYERELSFLKQEAVAFARAYPQLAARLDIYADDVENIDPHAERFIQGTALLAARVRHKLEDDFPELSDTLLDLVFPHFLQPIPTATIVELRTDPTMGMTDTRFVVPRGTALESQPVDGRTCRFSTCYDVTLFPLEVRSVVMESPATALPRGGTRASTASIVSRLQVSLGATGQAVVHEMGLDRLRFHLDGEAAVVHGLHELLLRRCRRVEISGLTADGQERVVALAPSSLQAVGFEENDALLPFPARSFGGFRLLREYFVLPEKFLFIDFCGLEVLAESGITSEMTISAWFDRAPEFHQELQASVLRLGCTPIVNLFRLRAEPISVDLKHAEYLVLPSLRDGDRTKAWAVEDVSPVELDVRVTPLFAFGHGSLVDGSELTWQSRRRTGADGAEQMWISLALPEKPSRQLAPFVLSVELLCTNGEYAAEIRLGDERNGDFITDPPLSSVRIIGRRNPTRLTGARSGRLAAWKLVSHLALNQVSLVSDGGAALRGLLELYEPTGTRAARQKIAAIRDLKSKQTTQVLRGSVVRGMDVEIVLDRAGFTGSGQYLFASVLDRFLASYVALNAFSRLVVVPLDQPEERFVFPARAGHQVLL